MTKTNDTAHEEDISSGVLPTKIKYGIQIDELLPSQTLPIEKDDQSRVINFVKRKYRKDSGDYRIFTTATTDGVLKLFRLK